MDPNQSFSADEIGFEVLIRLIDFDLKNPDSYTNFQLAGLEDYIKIDLYQ